MKLIKLTAFFSLAFAFLLSSCESDETFRAMEYSKTGIVLSAAQENNPANTSNALGSMDVHYRTDTKTLTYKVSWTGLTGAPTLMHIHGLAPTGFNAGVVQTILGASNPTLFPANGSYSGTMLIDGFLIKENDLINGFYYLNIHTTAWPGGEIRGQVRFQ